MIFRAFSRLAVYLSGIVSILQPLHVNAKDAKSTDQRLTIEAAWNQRKEVIKSLVLKAEVVEVTKGRGEQPAKDLGPFTDNPPKTDLRLVSKAEYYYDEGKTGLTRTGRVSLHDGSDNTVEQTFCATFDGQLNASLAEQPGEIGSGSIEKKRTAGGHISQNGLLLAVNLWLQPHLTLNGVGWDVDDMKTEKDKIDVDGIQCRRIRIPRGSSGWTSALDADAKRGWIPMQWQTWLNGRLSTKLSLQYETNEKVGPVVSGWTFAHYNKDGEIETMRKGRITHCETNVKVDPSHFKIDFPVGTRIWEDIPGGRRYYLQKAEGMVPVDEPKQRRKTTSSLHG
jgi:hypothetical protein